VREAQNLSTVLVVDDGPENLEILCNLLGPYFYVKVSTSGERALEMASTGSPPDLILLDIMMPGIDGYEVCRRLKSNPETCKIPIIFATAMEDQGGEALGLSLGAEDYITKPFNLPIVLARVQTHVALYQRTKELELQVSASMTANAKLKIAHAELMEAKSRLAQTERVKAAGVLIAGIAHELNTPIGNSVLTASTLKDRCVAFESLLTSGIRRADLSRFVAESAQASELILGNLEKAVALIDRLKRFSTIRHASTDRRSFAILQVVNQVVVGTTNLFARSGVNFLVNVSPELTIESYPEVWLEVMINLIENAIVHGFDANAPGNIEIQCHLAEDDVICLSVLDDGYGIKAEHLERIFDPFFTTKMGRNCTGLGLSFVHSFVTDLLCGSISVTSRPGNTHFMIHVPLRSDGPFKRGCSPHQQFVECSD